MNYKKIYNNIIEKALSSHRSKLPKANSDYIYYENHHIIPSCMGGSDDSSNRVLLTAQEHYIAHKCLYYSAKTEDEKYRHFCALLRFIGVEAHNVTAREYAFLRERQSTLQSKRISGKTHTKEARSNMSEAQLKRYAKTPSHWNGAKHTDETKKKMSKSQAGENNPQYGKSRSAETRAKISKAMKGKKKSKETIEKFKKRVKTDEEKRKTSESLKKYHEKRRRQQEK